MVWGRARLRRSQHDIRLSFTASVIGRNLQLLREEMIKRGDVANAVVHQRLGVVWEWLELK